MLIRVTILLNLNAKRGTGLLILMTVFGLAAVLWSFSTNKPVNDIYPVASPFKMDQMSTFTPSLFDEEVDTNSKKSILHTQEMCMIGIDQYQLLLEEKHVTEGTSDLEEEMHKKNEPYQHIPKN